MSEVALHGVGRSTMDLDVSVGFSRAPATTAQTLRATTNDTLRGQRTYHVSNQGPLLETLRDADYFGRVVVDERALCWLNGLELSPARLREVVKSGVGV